jgi:cytochrome b561
MTQEPWDNKVRLLHWTIVVSVTFQLFTSLFMADQGTQFLFPLHEIIGVIAALAILVFWLYSYAFYDLPILFPWNKAGMRVVWAELRDLLKGHLPAPGRRVGLSSFVHGLGLLAITGSAISGTVLFFMVPPGHVGPPSDPLGFTHYSLQHKFFGNLLWVYWLGHVGIALVHQLAGHRVLGGIFRLNSNPTGDAAGK